MACSNISRTREAPTPTNISTKSEPEILKNGTCASPAIARASSVLPVPGLPTINTPLGIRPPSFWNLEGSRKNSTSSATSSLASSHPATSLKVTGFCDLSSILALLFPNENAPPFRPPPCICRMKKIHTAISNSIGNHEINILINNEGSSSGFASTTTPDFSKSLTSQGSDGAYVVKRLPSVLIPRKVLPSIITFAIRP